MINKNISKPMKKWVKQKLRNSYLEFESARAKLEDDNKFDIYFPYKENADSYVILKNEENLEVCELGLPIPPVDLWLGYGNNVKEYLHGKQQIANMIGILHKGGFEISNMRSIMDFGCGAGRMIRWLKPYAETAEIWGTDISADHITWAINHLSPPFNFATTTTIPHMPFEEKYFDLIFAGSVFTHIDDLVEAWLLELRRVLSRRGCIYITIQDKNSIKLLKTSEYYKNIWLKQYVEENPLFIETGDKFNKIVGLRGTRSQVFYDQAYFKKIVGSIFEIISVNQEAYGFQTSFLLKRK